MNIDIYVDERLTAFPQIYCSHCGETIKDAANANLIFKESGAKRKPVIRDAIHDRNEIAQFWSLPSLRVIGRVHGHGDNGLHGYAIPDDISPNREIAQES